MAIKSVIQGLINSLIRSNPALIDKTELADVEDSILLNSYGTVFRETQLTTNTITTKNVSKPTFLYDVFICKQGRKVRIKGTITNNSASIISNSTNWFFEITNSEYLQNATMDAIALKSTCSTLDGSKLDVYLFGNRLIPITMGAFQVAYLDIEYLTEN